MIGEGREDVNVIASVLAEVSSVVSEAATRSEAILHGTDSVNAERMVASMGEFSRSIVENARSIEGVTSRVGAQQEAVAAIASGSENLGSLAEELRGALRDFHGPAVAPGRSSQDG